jgi:hypothetical protein
MKGKGLFFVPSDGRTGKVVLVKRDPQLAVAADVSQDAIREEFMGYMREHGAIK